jgi:hypothetical protein
MKYLIMYLAMVYIVACADHTGEDEHTVEQRIVRAAFWPVTLTSWFSSQNGRLHRLLNILWCVLIAGWFLSLMADRL